MCFVFGLCETFFKSEAKRLKQRDEKREKELFFIRLIKFFKEKILFRVAIVFSRSREAL